MATDESVLSCSLGNDPPLLGATVDGIDEEATKAPANRRKLLRSAIVVGVGVILCAAGILQQTGIMEVGAFVVGKPSMETTGNEEYETTVHKIAKPNDKTSHKDVPKLRPTELPTMESTDAPTESPTASPRTGRPTKSPIGRPTKSPTESPTTTSPTAAPSTEAPTVAPSTTSPTASPSTESPTETPTMPPKTDKKKGGNPTTVEKVTPNDNTLSAAPQDNNVAPLGYPYCDQNSTSSHCCSKDHCKLVTKSTLFSQCCHNIVSGPPGSQKPHQIFPILITATPRSGTVFTQTLLTKLGVGVTTDWATPSKVGMVSWMHIVQDTRYFGPAVVRHSKFMAAWHQVRDPLKSLTSVAFTEPLRQDRKNTYVHFLNRHIALTPKVQVLRMEQIQSEDDFLIWRGMEFYMQWHQYILSLNLRRFQLEDLVVRHNMTLLDSIFESMNRTAPNHDKAIRIIEHGRRRRQLLQKLRHGIRKLHTNSRKHRDTLQWEELCRVAPDKVEEFLDLSHEFGYYLNMTKAC